MAKLIPAILSRDAGEVAEKLAFLAAQPGIDEVQIDFADGKFVSVTTIRPRDLPLFPTSLQIEAHLMTVAPQQYFHDLEHKGVRSVLLHYESFFPAAALLAAIGNLTTLGLRAGVVINPETELAVFDGLIAQIQIAGLMNIHPGPQGQRILPESFARVETLRKIHPTAIIEVDGGINLENFQSLVAHGADRLVVGSGIWQTPDPQKTIKKFFKLLQ